MDIFKRKMWMIIICFFIIIDIPIESHAGDMMFYSILARDGLSQNTVKTIFQDSNGYMWIGTLDGLNKYNGYEFEVYNRGFEDKRNICNGFITQLNEDNYKNLWVGTLDGLSKINLNTDEIVSYTTYNSSLISDKIRSINIDSKGDVLISTSKGLNIYDRDKDDFILLGNTNIDIEASEIYRDNDVYGISKQILFKYDRENEELVFIKSDILDQIRKNDSFTYISILNDNLYLGTRNSGLYVYDIDKKAMEKEFKFYRDGSDNEATSIQYIYNDEKFLCVGTDDGLYVIDNEGNEKRYINDPFNKYSIVSNNIQCIVKDSSGLLWIGTNLGISNVEYAEGVKYINTDYLDSKSVNRMVIGIYEDVDSNVWMGIYGYGLKIVDKNESNIRYITVKDGLSTNRIWDIKGNDKYIFLATEKGVNIIDRQTYNVKVILEGLSEELCSDLYVDGNYLWIGNMGGFDVLDLRSYKVQNMKSFFDDFGISVSLGGVIFKDSKGIYWLGTSTKDGLIRVSKEDRSFRTFKFSEDENSISDNSVISIAEDGQGNMWFGTEAGLNKYNREKDEFYSYSIMDGLSNNTIYSIIPYKENEIWISTNWGIDHLIFEGNKIVRVKKYLRGVEFNVNSFIEVDNGYFLLGGIDGLYIVNPSSVEKKAYIPKLHLHSFEVNGIEVKNLNNTVVDYKDNLINIELFTNIYGNTQNIKYYYSINNGEWILMNDHKLTFSNLESGKYNIDFQADNLNGGISEIESLRFTVKPPFWASTLFKISYVGIVITAICYIFFKIRAMGIEISIRDNQLKNEMKEKNELLKKNIELEKRKNNYLINMSHELRTPLNVISSVQQLIVDINKRRPLEQKEITKYMDMSDNNIKRLLKIINDLVDSSKIDEGNYKLFIEENDIVYVAEEAVLSLKTLIEGKGINLVFDTEIEECIMKFDENAISRCIINVVANASKFTEAGGEIFVNITDLKDKIKIDISDTGIGISKDEIGNIFNRFNQVINSKRELSQGNGLGLTITKKLIELHNGEISAESEVGKGTTFTIILPKNN